MERQIKIRITKDGKVEVDSTVFKDCREVAEHLTKHLGVMESFRVKEDEESEAAVGVKSGKKD